MLTLLLDQRAYDRRIKGLEKAYEKQVYKSVDKCKDDILARAKREAYEEYKELNKVLEEESNEQRKTKERSNKRMVHTTGDRDFLG